MLTKLNLMDLKSMQSLSIMGKNISISDGNPQPDSFICKSAIGALQYLTTTRPDIVYAVNYFSQYLKQPTDVHWQVIKSVFCAMSVVPNIMVFYFNRVMISQFMAFSDADWASNNIAERKSLWQHIVPLLVLI